MSDYEDIWEKTPDRQAMEFNAKSTVYIYGYDVMIIRPWTERPVTFHTWSLLYIPRYLDTKRNVHGVI